MGKLNVFNSISLDGFFVDAQGGMGWAYSPVQDEEWNEFVSGNARGGGPLLLGRVTYEMMAAYWPTPEAARAMPEVARGINAAPKTVFSRTLKTAAWNNTRVVGEDLAAEVRRLKAHGDLAVLGSGSIVAQLAADGLVDELQLVVVPVVLGAGRTLFEGLGRNLRFGLVQSRTFRNGNVFVSYRPA